MLIYLASPYSDYSEEVRKQRFEKIAKIAAHLMSQGFHIFCPITHTHPITVFGELPTGFDYWVKYDERFLGFCDELWVSAMDGWQKSKGVTSEIRIMRELHKPIHLIPGEIDYMFSQFVNWRKEELAQGVK